MGVVKLFLRLTGRVAVGVMMAVLLTFAAGALHPRDWLAFTANGNGTTDIFLVDLTTGKLTNILPRRNRCSETEATWSPDGMLAFVQNCYYFIATSKVVIFDLNHFLPFTPLTFREARPVWSPDSRLAFESGYADDPGLYVGDPLTGEFVDVAQGHDIRGRPAWSNDGRLAFATFANNTDYLSVREADGQVNDVAALGARMLAWSNDGRLAFAHANRGSFIDTIYILANGELHPITNVLVADTVLSWSPDGQITLAVYNAASNRDIVLLNPDTGVLTTLLDDPADDRSPRWSPDGRRLAFISNRGGVGGQTLYVLDMAMGVITPVSERLQVVDAPAWAGKTSP